VDRSIKNGFPFIESNVLGTFTLLEAARSNPTLQIIHASTDEVYGSVNDGESLETDPLRPSSSYSSSKASSDLIALAQRHTFGQKITVTRCCNNYGPWQDKEKVIPTFILKSIQGNPMPIYGNGMNIREWIHVSDHVRAILYLINTRSNDDIVNIGTSERLTNLELAEIIAKELRISDNFLSYVDDRLGHDYRYALNSRKINDLGWNPVKTIKTGLVETVQWYKENANYFLETY
jgi:dTDP-glucose 4,6-dehydratase